MATLTANQPISLFGFNFSNLFITTGYETTPTSYRVSHDSGAIDVFSGTDFTYNDAGEILTGTVTGYQLERSDGAIALVIEGLSYDAAAMRAAGLTETFDDDLALLKSMFIGNDEMTGSTGDDQLDGFGGDDTLSGGKGSDVIVGWEGKDVLLGGGQSDTFSFVTGDGADRIDDFRATGKNHDVIDVSDVDSIASFKDLVKNHLSENRAGDAIIRYGDGDKIVLADVDVADLDRGDFLF